MKTDAREIRFRRFLLFLAGTLAILGAIAMDRNNESLNWEWPAGRKLETRLLVRIVSIAPASRGIFGIAASPSLAQSLPDAQDVVAVVATASDSDQKRRVTVRLPGIEAKKLTVGGLGAFGLISSGRTCICVEQPPKPDFSDAQLWIASWQCHAG
jgi:hypothetical protein